MKKIIEGHGKFRKQVYPAHRELFEGLATSQKPEALFITCADSRIDPCLITQTKPGEIFICRNAGNIVPAYGDAIGGVSATIEYAVAALEVGDIILCGHSDCGGMWGLLYPERVAAMPAVAAWVRHGPPARKLAEQRDRGLDGEELLMAITEENVVTQLKNLRTHPSVARAMAAGKLRLHGWIYHIHSGEIRVYQEEAARFGPLEAKVSGRRAAG